MSRLGPLPPIGQTSLPDGVSQQDWEKQFKSALKGQPVPFPDVSTSALHQLSVELAAQPPKAHTDHKGKIEEN
eukprot:CAMPEP_0171090880 /NCGR_PEP_ID=MMETSP0766_2-20121228/32116_1 /TAXON_ID=439317 /ORGANISM="Gambierdiscus australes, Strain CAWD 149" /LENGTH=72 /DNA_ID=CAMNT_0011548921 /DNA_START=27 /DNA_END=245 /DNA_ORIENTATION=+